MGSGESSMETRYPVASGRVSSGVPGKRPKGREMKPREIEFRILVTNSKSGFGHARPIPK